MNPKKAKDFIPQEAERQGIPQKDLEDMIRGFYRVVKDNMENFGSHLDPQECIEIKGLGRVRVAVIRLTKQIEREEKFLNLKSYRNKPMVEERQELRKKKACMKLHKDELQKKIRVQQKRKILKNISKKNKK